MHPPDPQANLLVLVLPLLKHLICISHTEQPHYINSISMCLPLYRSPNASAFFINKARASLSNQTTSIHTDSCSCKSLMALRAATCLLLLAMAMLTHTSARVLDEVQAAMAPAAPVDTPPELAPMEAPPSPPLVDTPPVDTAPAPASVTPASEPATAAAAGPAANNSLTFFMHDILDPSARTVTGIVTNAAVNGQLPYAKPSGAVLPVNGGVTLNKADNGVINNNNIPFLTGLGGTTNTVAQNNGVINTGASGQLPFFTGGNLPAGPTFQKLLFGTTTVIDDELTEGHEIGSGAVGKAQGFYIASSEDGTSQTMAFTAMFKEGEYADSLSFFGVYRTADPESHLAVVGGTGKYVNARGFATLRTLPPVDDTDGVETLVQVAVTLVY